MSFKQSARASHIHDAIFVIQINNCSCLLCSILLIYTQKAHVWAARYGLAYVPACIAMECAKASLMPVCMCLSANVCRGILACLRFTCCTEHVLHGIYMLSVQSRLVIWYLHWQKDGSLWGGKSRVKGQRMDRDGGALRLSGGVSCTCNFTLMNHSRWKTDKHSLMVL